MKMFLSVFFGILAAVFVLFLSCGVLCTSLTDDTFLNENLPAGSNALDYEVIGSKQSGSMVVAQVKITNISEKTITSCKGILVAKNNNKKAIAFDEHYIASHKEHLLPGESTFQDYFFDDIKESDIAYWGFKVKGLVIN